jgi:hypothetical protein
LTVPPTLLALADEVIEWVANLLQCRSPLVADFVAKVPKYQATKFLIVEPKSSKQAGSAG